MTQQSRERLREILEQLAQRIRGDIAGLEDAARLEVGGQAGGNLSNAPMHLADLGTEQYMQELNATLLENEEYLGREIVAALRRFEQGTYGLCERCGEAILEERLEVLPYTRYCTACAEETQAGHPTNLNDGRPVGGFGGLNRRHGREDESDGSEFEFEVPDTRRGAPRTRETDIHAAGTAGGGTAVGGLAGTNLGEGDPDDGNLEEALGSGNYDVALEAEDSETTPYAGHSGGAVGGTPAEKRAAGGRTHGGLAPRPGPGDSVVGP